jgi:hypothetical protein
MRNRITTESGIRKIFPNLTESELEGVRIATQRFSMALTPYLTTLIDGHNPSCPLRIQFIPRKEESVVSQQESLDPCVRALYGAQSASRYPTEFCSGSIHCPAIVLLQRVEVGESDMSIDWKRELNYIKEQQKFR